MYIQKFKPDVFRNYCADLNQTLYESFQVQGNEKVKVKFCNLGFSMGKVKTVDFSETIAASDLKVGRCRQLIE